jgi:hypothetical protein
VAAHQATYLENCQEAKKYFAKLLARSLTAGNMMERFQGFEKWRLK